MTRAIQPDFVANLTPMLFQWLSDADNHGALAAAINDALNEHERRPAQTTANFFANVPVLGSAASSLVTNRVQSIRLQFPNINASNAVTVFESILGEAGSSWAAESRINSVSLNALLIRKFVYDAFRPFAMKILFREEKVEGYPRSHLMVFIDHISSHERVDVAARAHEIHISLSALKADSVSSHTYPDFRRAAAVVVDADTTIASTGAQKPADRHAQEDEQQASANLGGLGAASL